MEESDGQMSRVQRELMALRQSGTVKTQADKLKDCKFVLVQREVETIF
jgi:hypothetical protein